MSQKKAHNLPGCSLKKTFIFSIFVSFKEERHHRRQAAEEHLKWMFSEGRLTPSIVVCIKKLHDWVTCVAY